MEVKALCQSYGVNTGALGGWGALSYAGSPQRGALSCAARELPCCLVAPQPRQAALPCCASLQPATHLPLRAASTPRLPELVELRNLVTVGELIMSSALQRRESRGGHYCQDYPQEDMQVRCACCAVVVCCAAAHAGCCAAALPRDLRCAMLSKHLRICRSAPPRDASIADPPAAAPTLHPTACRSAARLSSPKAPPPAAPSWPASPPAASTRARARAPPPWPCPPRPSCLAARSHHLPRPRRGVAAAPRAATCSPLAPLQRRSEQRATPSPAADAIGLESWSGGRSRRLGHKAAPAQPHALPPSTDTPAAHAVLRHAFTPVAPANWAAQPFTSSLDSRCLADEHHDLFHT